MIAILGKHKILNNTVAMVTCQRNFSVSVYKNQFWVLFLYQVLVAIVTFSVYIFLDFQRLAIL